MRLWRRTRGEHRVGDMILSGRDLLEKGVVLAIATPKLREMDGKVVATHEVSYGDARGAITIAYFCDGDDAPVPVPLALVEVP